MSILAWERITTSKHSARYTTWRAEHKDCFYDLVYKHDTAMGPEIAQSDPVLWYTSHSPGWQQVKLSMPSELAVVTIHDMILIAERFILTPLERLAQVKERNDE